MLKTKNDFNLEGFGVLFSSYYSTFDKRKCMNIYGYVNFENWSMCTEQKKTLTKHFFVYSKGSPSVI